MLRWKPLAIGVAVVHWMEQRMSSAGRAATIREWRELGFFYDRDDTAKAWRIVASHSGVARFCKVLRQYAADSRNERISEHEHYGPYRYLEIMTWTEARIDGHAIGGTLDDFRQLADLIEARAASCAPGSAFRIGPEFSKSGDYELEVRLMPEPFDPAAQDPQ